MEQKKKREKTPAETRIILSFLSGGKENTRTHAHTRSGRDSGCAIQILIMS